MATSFSSRRSNRTTLSSEQKPLDAWSASFFCRTIGGEGVHMNRVHGEVHPVRSLVHGTQCSACLREYFTHGKLKAHLIRSHHCCRTLIGRGLQSPLNRDLDPPKTQPDSYSALAGSRSFAPSRTRTCLRHWERWPLWGDHLAHYGECEHQAARAGDNLFHGLAAGSCCRRLDDRLRQAFLMCLLCSLRITVSATRNDFSNHSNLNGLFWWRTARTSQHLAVSLRIFLIS